MATCAQEETLCDTRVIWQLLLSSLPRNGHFNTRFVHVLYVVDSIYGTVFEIDKHSSFKRVYHIICSQLRVSW